MLVPPSDPLGPPDPRDPHALDFAEWERQMAARRRRGRARFVAYAGVYAVVLICGTVLILLHNPMLGIAVLLITAVVTVLWLSER